MTQATEEKAPEAAEATTALGASTPEVPPTKKEELYRLIAKRLNAKVDDSRGKGKQVFGDTHARDLLVDMFKGLTDILLQTGADGLPQEGSLGIPAGYGSLQLGTAAATKKKTPQGQVVDVPKRWRIVWRPGKIIDDRLEALPPPTPDPVVPAAPTA